MANTIFRDLRTMKKKSELLSRPSDRARSITPVQRIFAIKQQCLSLCRRGYTYGCVALARLIAARRMSDNRLSKNLPVSDVTFAHVMGIVATRERALTIKKQEYGSTFKSLYHICICPYILFIIPLTKLVNIFFHTLSVHITYAIFLLSQCDQSFILFYQY